METYSNIDEYISNFPAEVQLKLEEMRSILHSLVPDAEEAISYGIPTLKYKKKNLIHFAAFKAHIGLYPGAKTIEDFLPELSKYNTSKGTVQFPLSEKLPVALIKKITKYRLTLATR